MRPKLHRYCVRMVGSVIDGEDVLQDALAKAIEAHSTAGHIGNPEGWLFRIAHNAALDFLRRAMISDDVRLDLVNKTQMRGKAELHSSFGNYAKVTDWHLVPGVMEGRPAILVFDPSGRDAGPKDFVLLGWVASRVATIRDFRHAAYAIDGAEYAV
ncbi:RNA polymerase sigma factor [Bradyrhizobium roseum]|uniref:RNA polymerase sigma factor n=1 Tax=Bradyrhizobium roseum TaxID=3056648 RepID=UPI0026382E80|nr:sigma factor [Bradyrhizobium roseus]WKA32197.1 sigma factor [Bradyrhizobium roseus]